MIKNILKFAIVSVAAVCLAACSADNYDELTSTITGNIQYQGKNLNLCGTQGATRLQLYQEGYELNTQAFTVYADQEGHFSCITGDGIYKLVTEDNVGPWVNKRDTTIVTLKGHTEVNIEVKPYFLIGDDAAARLDGNKLTVNYSVQKIVPEAEINNVTINVGSTLLVDEWRNQIKFTIGAEDVKIGQNTVTEELTDAQLAIFKKYNKFTVRVGLRTKGASNSIYSPLITVY